MKRKEIAEILKNEFGVENKFTVRTISFCDLARDSKKFITIKGWKPDPIAGAIKERFRGTEYIVDFD